MMTTAKVQWVNKQEGFKCDVDYLKPDPPHGSPGNLDSIDLCKSQCEEYPECRSITYFSKSKWCSHFSTPCGNKKASKQAILWVKRNAGLPTNETPSLVAL